MKRTLAHISIIFNYEALMFIKLSAGKEEEPQWEKIKSHWWNRPAMYSTMSSSFIYFQSPPASVLSDLTPCAPVGLYLFIV